MWGFVGGLALVIGALLAFAVRPSKRTVAFVMAFGAGVLISAVAYDLTADAGEARNVATAHSDVVAEFDRYFATARTPSPHWPDPR